MGRPFPESDGLDSVLSFYEKDASFSMVAERLGMGLTPL